jgi:hypothetical protein
MRAPLVKRLGWFILLYGISVLVLGLAALAIKAVIG